MRRESLRDRLEPRGGTMERRASSDVAANDPIIGMTRVVGSSHEPALASGRSARPMSGTP